MGESARAVGVEGGLENDPKMKTKSPPLYCLACPGLELGVSRPREHSDLFPLQQTVHFSSSTLYNTYTDMQPSLVAGMRRMINTKLQPTRVKYVAPKDQIQMWRIVRGDEVK